MLTYINDYWKDFSEQAIGMKPLDKVEIELSAGTWTDVTDYYLGGATFDQEKERAPDIISAGDTRYTFDNTEDTFTPKDSGSIFYGVTFHNKRIRYSVGFYGLGYYAQSVMRIKDVKWDYDEQICYIFAQENSQRLIDESLNPYPLSLIPTAATTNVGNGSISAINSKPFATVSENWTLTCDFLVVTDSNKYLDFNIGGAELNATIPTGNYTTASLSNAIQNQLASTEPTGTYSVSFSSSTKKFTITRSAGTFQILWKTGTHGSDNTDTHIGSLTGYDDTSDDTGSLSYTSDTALDYTFSVIGSVSGDIGTATVGTEFSDSTYGIKFTISEGSTLFAPGDTFTFSTIQYPEWTNTNPAKILWSILTGYGYDSETQDNWYAGVFDFDNIKADSNPDINYSSFVDAIADIGNNLTGYIPYDKNAAEAIQEIIIHFLGSLYVDRNGKIALATYQPKFGTEILHTFADTKKVFSMNAEEETSRIINKVTVFCKRTASFAWSDTGETTDDVYSSLNTTSISTYGLKNPRTYTDYWYSANKVAQQWFADRLTSKYGDPPLLIEFDSGLEPITTELADRIKFTDARTGFTNQLLEVMKIAKDFESRPKSINLTGWDTGTGGVKWCWLGSSADEGDGISPQAADYDNATTSDRQFVYLSQTGGEGTEPDYYLF